MENPGIHHDFPDENRLLSRDQYEARESALTISGRQIIVNENLNYF